MLTSNILISAGEASGDLHAANLVAACRALGLEAGLWGMGGGKLAAQGVELLVDCQQLAYIGFVDVVIHYPKILKELNKLRDEMERRKPAALVLVDYPGFNMKLAHHARKLGIPVFYYISPQIWAWRPHRIREIADVVDLMAVLFPFEVDVYERAGIAVRFVGHPLVDEVRAQVTPAAFRREFEIPATHRLIGLLPGSRGGEIRRIAPILAATAEQLTRQAADLSFVVPVADTVDRSQLEEIFERRGVAATLVEGRTYDAINACDAVATSSGTATLEIALLGIPMAIVYRVGAINYRLMKRLLTIDHIGLANIVAQRRIVKEFIQHQAEPRALAEELLRILTEPAYARRMKDDLREVARRLGEGGASERAAEAVTAFLAERRQSLA